MSGPSTFSVVARDRTTGDLGVAVQSKFLAVGALVPYALADVGAVATQALVNTTYGPEGLRLLAEGLTADVVIERLVSADPAAGRRQVGVVDARGHGAAYTGQGCQPWAGHIVGEGFSCQGNILASPAVVQAMADVMVQESGPFPERLVTALDAGQSAGGDRRGQQSGALVVVRQDGGYGRRSDRYIDLRVDDSPQPIIALRRLLGLHRLYFERPGPSDLLTIDDQLAFEIVRRLQMALGTPVDAESLGPALERWRGIENLEERDAPPGQIDRRVLEVLRERTAP